MGLLDNKKEKGKYYMKSINQDEIREKLISTVKSGLPLTVIARNSGISEYELGRFKRGMYTRNVIARKILEYLNSVVIPVWEPESDQE